MIPGQKVLYALGDKLFVTEGPYIINLPPMRLAEEAMAKAPGS